MMTLEEIAQQHTPEVLSPLIVHDSILGNYIHDSHSGISGL
jgi:hypothetical protein